MATGPRMPLLVVDDLTDRSAVEVATVNGLVKELSDRNIEPVAARDLADAVAVVRAEPELSGILVVWNNADPQRGLAPLHSFADSVRRTNDQVPLFVITRYPTSDDVTTELRSLLTMCKWVAADDVDRLAGHMLTAIASYRLAAPDDRPR